MRLIQNLMDQLIADQYSDLYILPNENGYQLLAMPKINRPGNYLSRLMRHKADK